MKRFFVAFILMIVGFSASAELIHTTIKFEDFGDVFVEYDTSNKGLVYKETNVLVCQAHLAQFYSKDCYIDVSEIYYQSRDVDNYGFNAFAYKVTKDHGWLIATIDDVKFCFYNVDDNTVAGFSICLKQKK